MDLKGYPKEMRHPAYVPAVLSGYTRDGRGTRDDPPGKPVRFPPVFVNNADQEQYYASMGYLPPGVVPGTEQAAKYLAGTIGDERPGLPYEHQDYPRWLYRLGTNLEIESALAETPEAEAQLGDGWFTDLAAVKAVQADMKAEEASKPEGSIQPQTNVVAEQVKRKYQRRTA